jgi:hypothetical protein
MGLIVVAEPGGEICKGNRRSPDQRIKQRLEAQKPREHLGRYADAPLKPAFQLTQGKKTCGGKLAHANLAL